MNLYELQGAYRQIQELAEQGEDYEGVLATLTEALEDKADGYARIIKNLNVDIDAIKVEKDRLDKRQKALLSHVDYLKNNLEQAMVACGKKKFNTELFSFSVQKNGGKAPIIVDVECEKLPDNLVTISEKPNLDAIRQYIDDTGDNTYAHFGERGESLRIK